MESKNFKASLTIDGGVGSTFKKAFSTADKKIGDLTKSIRGMRSQQNKIGRDLRGLEETSEEARKAKKEFDRLGDEIKRADARLKSLNSRKQAFAKLGTSFGNMRQQVGSTARSFAFLGTAAAGGIFALAKSTADLGDNVAKTADKIGVSVSRLQEMRFAAERSGMEVKVFDKALQEFTRKTAEAAEGTGEALDAFEKLGLSAEALKNMTPDEALLATADALQKVENQTEKVGLAYDLFGGRGIGMVNMLRGGRTEMEKLYEAAQRTGYVLSEKAARDAETFTDRMLEAKLSLLGVKNTIGAELMPILTAEFSRFSEYVSANRDEIVKFAKSFSENVKSAIPTILELTKGLATFASTIGGVISKTAKLVGGFDNLAFIAAGMFAGKTIASVFTFGSALAGLGPPALEYIKNSPRILKAMKLIRVAALKLNATMLANPIGIIAVAIAGAAFLIYKYWEPISGFFKDLWGGIALTFNAYIDAIVKRIEWVGNIASNLKDKITSPLQSVGGAFSSLKEKIGIGGSESDTPRRGRSRRAINQAANRSAVSNSATTNNQITVNAAPGQDSRSIADEVMWRLNQQPAAAGALYD